MSIHLQRDLEALEQNLLSQSSMVEQMVFRAVPVAARAARRDRPGGDRQRGDGQLPRGRDRGRVPQDSRPAPAGGRRSAARRHGAQDQRRPGADRRPGGQHFRADAQPGAAPRLSDAGASRPDGRGRDLDGPRLARRLRAAGRRTRPARCACATTWSTSSTASSSPTCTTSCRPTRTDIEPAFHFYSASRHVERIADHATNISEDVIYLVDGEIARHRHDGIAF